ncbi:glycoside hydrolase superfamily [Radiomyces spectabilis]|uniref:glycoside hydrolase superfamily n=1 Tax=Radiomyces spectabilis TaxID=64574 RepID=UPI0022209D5B|nr:glycoside hydrolase superfamily [Radiomyces spectabilis]KAI8380963.1 glycoside hydrolase superfamily [Radiomyces spectabilis]
MHSSLFIFGLVFLVATLVQALPINKRDGSLYGVTYTGLNPDGSCQSPAQVLKSMQTFKKHGIMNVRTYSQECDQLPHILDAMQKTDPAMTVLAAVWIEGSDRDEKEIKQLQKVLESGKNRHAIRGITVGNEVVFKNHMDPGSLVEKMKTVKGIASKYGIKVGTVETADTYTDELIDASDLVVVNIHPFFQPVKISDAADAFVKQYNAFKKKAHGKEVLVGETGWPSAGDSNGPAVPSVENMATYVNGITKTDIPYYFFEAQDASWKGDGHLSVEPHWGLENHSGNFKFAT